MDYTAIGMMYLKAAEEIEGPPGAACDRMLPQAKAHLDSAIQGLEYVLRGNRGSTDDDYNNIHHLLKVYPELRHMDKPIEYLKEHSSIMDALIHSGNSPDIKKAMDFLDKIGSRYIGADIAPLLE